MSLFNSNPNQTDMTFHLIAMACFAATFVLHWIYIRKSRYLSRKISLPLLTLGFVSLTAFLVLKGKSIHACPIGNPYEIISFTVWSSLFLFILISLVFKVNYFGFFTAGLAAITLLVINLAPGLNYSYDAGTMNTSHVVGFHASLAVFSYGIFAIQALFAMMYLVQYHGLSKRRVGNFFSILPPLMKLEKLQVGTLAVGVFVLSVSLFMGSFSIFHGVGEVPVYKLSATVLVWIIYLLILLLHIFKRLVSAVFAWASILAFVVALSALVPVDRARHEPEKPDVGEQLRINS